MMNEQEGSDVDFGALEAMLGERMRWAAVQLPLATLGEAAPELLDDLSRFERISTVALIAGLLTEPAYQSTTLRIELLIAFAVLHARGTQQPTVEDLARWFAAIGESEATCGEDPAEDVLVTLVTMPHEHFRIIEGLWESAGFYTQCVLGVLQRMPDSGIYGSIKADVRALLMVSELACEKAGLVRYQTGSEDIPDALDLPSLPSTIELRGRVMFSVAELARHGVHMDQLRAFILPPEGIDALADQEPGLSELDRYPLLATDDGVVLALPTAVSTAVRDRVIDLVLATRQILRFDANYADVLGHIIAETALFASKSGCQVHWHRAGADHFGSAIYPFDRGHYLVLHFILPSIESHSQGRFKHPTAVSETLSRALDSAIASTTKQVKGFGDFREGLHLVVMCGWGQGMTLSVAQPDGPRWRGESVSVADLIRLSNVESMSVERFWRLKAAEDKLAQAGVDLFNVNGVLNLFGWMAANGGHLVPHADLGDGRISPERPLVINPPLNLLRDLRAQADQSTDVHVRIDPRGEAHRLQRVNPRPYFPGPATSRVYACIDCTSQHELVAVCEGRPTLWLRVEMPSLTSAHLQFRLWDMLGSWGGQIVHALEARDGKAGSFELLIHFEDVQEEVDAPEALTPDDPQASLRFDITGETTATVHAARGFLHAFRDPSNKAERALVTVMLRALLAMIGEVDPERVVEGLKPCLMPNDTCRHFHVMQAQDFTDYVREALPSKVLDVDNIDSAELRLGLGWSVYEGPNDVEGAEACRGLLNKLVDARVAHVIRRLGELDRTFLVRRLLLNHEAAHASEMHWKRTSAAVIGLHGNTPELRATVVEQLATTAGAQITSRVLAEMAVCAAPIADGRIPADLDVQSLLAEIALLIRLGGLSDGIYYGALEPRMRVSPLGDILVKDLFGQEVVEPMLSTAVGDQYVRSAANHRRHYIVEGTVDRTEHLLEGEFVQAWNTEMGFEIDQGRRLVDLLEGTAIRQRSPILTMMRSELMTLLSTVVNPQTAERFVDRFSLLPRPKWEVPPMGFKAREILPWRFGRRLSLVSRPLLQIDEAADPRYLIAPRLVRSGFFYVLRGAYDGTLDQEFFTSTQMRDSWWGQANEGHTFNAEVAETLRAAGWHAKENVELPAVLQKKVERDYGDVDVLAWRPGHDEVFVIECKDLSFRRNYSEIAALMSDYRGELKNGKPDKLRRHLNRVERLQQDIASLGRHTGIGNPTIVSCVIVGGLVPMQFASIPALDQTFVGDVDAFVTRFAPAVSD